MKKSLFLQMIKGIFEVIILFLVNIARNGALSGANITQSSNTTVNAFSDKITYNAGPVGTVQVPELREVVIEHVKLIEPAAVIKKVLSK